MARKVILYIAMSLDGYIAKENDNLDYLSIVERPGEDYGYTSFQKEVDTLIWGRKTYDVVQSFGIEFPHKDKRVIVLSRTKTGKDEHVEFFNGNIKDLIKELQQQKGKNIYCDGGGEVVFELLRFSLIDKMIISIIPHLVGSGKRLFVEGRPEQYLKFLRCITFPSGLVQLWYEKKETSN